MLLARAWRGELNLYYTAFALGGVGLSVVGLACDVVALTLAFQGGRAMAAFDALVDLAEIGFAAFICVAVWRSAERGKPDGRRYAALGVTVSFAFVALQLAVTVAWTLLGLVGLLPGVEEGLLRRLIQATGGDAAGLDQLMHLMSDQKR